MAGRAPSDPGTLTGNIGVQALLGLARVFAANGRRQQACELVLDSIELERLAPVRAFACVEVQW